MQRDIFAEQLGKQMGIEGLRADDWSALFTLLARQTEQGEVVILLDEISWMASNDPLFLGKLKNAWDLEFKKNPKLILVLCGSVSTWIEKNIISSTAFFGRISLYIELKELPLSSCHKLLQANGFKQSTYEEFKLLSVTGGIPWYIEQVRKGASADETIKHLCFEKEGVLFHEFNAIFHDLFEKRSEIYRPIVEVLANGPMEFNAICKTLNNSKSGTMSEYLNDLIESGFVTRDFTWSIKTGSPSKLSYYRLSDNYLRFYLKYVQPNRDRILRDAYSTLDLSSLTNWSTIVGLQFENLILNNRKILWQALNIKPENIVADNPYFQRKTSRQSGCQIDYLIQTKFNTLLACEIKFSRNPIKPDVIKEMQQKIAALPLPKRFSCWPVLIHVNGICDSIADADYFTHIIDFSDFLQ